MTNLQFQKATKKRSKARVAIDGPSGAGKTYTALIAATVLADGGRVAVIDTERGSASLYSDEFAFDVLELSNYNPLNYVQAIEAAEQAGYAVVVVDSLSHAWEGEGGALDLVDQGAKRSKSGNNFTAWKEVTPLHRRLVDTMLQSSCHIVATMRSKTEYVLETVERNGRTFQQPRKVGMAPIQRQGMEYEFTIVADMDIEHNLAVTKSRCRALADKVEKLPGAAFWKTFHAWLNSGDTEAVPARQSAPPPMESDYAEADAGPDFDAPPGAPENSKPPAPVKPNAKMMTNWLKLVEEAKALGVPVPVLTQGVTAAQLAEVGGRLREAVTAARSKAVQGAAQRTAGQPANNGEKKKFSREELAAYVEQLGAEAIKLNIVGLAWKFNPRWTNDELVQVGKDLKTRIAAHKAKEPAHV